jgi:hypothetical protein
VSAAKRFKIGDWVTVTGAHPHKGESGTITEASPIPGFDWIVEFSEAYAGSANVSERNLRAVS